MAVPGERMHASKKDRHTAFLYCSLNFGKIKDSYNSSCLTKGLPTTAGAGPALLVDILAGGRLNTRQLYL